MEGMENRFEKLESQLARMERMLEAALFSGVDKAGE